ncbi:MAG: Wzz/FepE/Etk N-terminal domain-containing protein [Bacillota bacterium]
MEEEINLRELIEVLIRGKVLIAVITIVAVLVSGVFSFFIISPTYQAKATLLISQPNVRALEADSMFSVLLESVSQYPIMTMETLRRQVKNPDVLQAVIDSVQAGREEMTSASLADKIEVQAVKDTRLLEISVNDKDPIFAAEIANMLSQEFINFINEQNKHRMSQSVSFLEKQIQIEGLKLDEAVAEMKKFLSQSPGVDELSKDIGAKLTQLTGFKTSMVNKQLELEKLQASLSSALEELEQTPMTLTTKKSVIDDPLLSGLIKDTEDTDTSSLSAIGLETEEINPVYVSLLQKISSNNITISQIETELIGLDREIKSLTLQLEKLKAQYAEKKTLHEQLEQKVNTLRGTYRAFDRKYEEVRIAASAEMGDNTVTIMASAQVPEKPIAPKKRLNVAIAGVLGIMVGVFVVFFREFWINSNPKKANLSV